MVIDFYIIPVTHPHCRIYRHCHSTHSDLHRIEWLSIGSRCLSMVRPKIVWCVVVAAEKGHIDWLPPNWKHLAELMAKKPISLRMVAMALAPISNACHHRPRAWLPSLEPHRRDTFATMFPLRFSDASGIHYTNAINKWFKIKIPNFRNEMRANSP